MSTGALEGQGAVPGNDVDKDALVAAEGNPAEVTNPPPSGDDADADDLALAEIRKAAEAEGPGQDGSQGEGKTQNDPPAGTKQPEQGEGQQPQGGKPKAVPIERFEQVYNDRKRLQDEVARLAGENIALKSQTAPAQPTVNPKIADLDAQIASLAKKFDDGEITYSELKRQEREIDAQILAIREEDLVARAAQRTSQPAPQPVNDLTFQRETKRLEAEYEPYLDLIPDAYFDGFVSDVRAKLAAEGITEIRANSEELLLLRERIGQAAKAEAAFWSQKSGKPVPTGGQTQPTQAQPARPAAQPSPEQRLAKLAMQSEMPPNLGSLNRTGGVDDAPTEAAIEAMSDEEIAMLSPNMRNKLLGITP